MNVYEAISVRKSVREYQMKPLEEGLFSSMQKYMKEILFYQEELSYEIVVTNQLETHEKKRKGFFTVRAPYYISVLVKEGENVRIHAGFIAEQLVLYLTCKGIGTCYQGNLHVLEHVQKGYRESVVIACGYPLHHPHREERCAKRMPLSKLCVFKEEPDKSVMTILRAAALAPSSMNSQPWRFVVYNSRIHVFLQKDNRMALWSGKLHQIDIGIMLAHMSIAAEELWMNAKYEKIDAVRNQEFKYRQYITSMMLSM